jgi:hypothetical protein
MERFWRKVEKQDNGCWLWTGAKNRAGYGQLRINGRNVMAHRFLFEATVGPLPPFKHGGYELDHVVCDEPSCVNPDHERVVLHKENVLRGKSPAAQQARQTHCIRGHRLEGKNLYKASFRLCKICRDNWGTTYYANNAQRINARRRDLYAAKRGH